MIYQINNREFDDCPKGFYTTLEYEVKKVQYLDKCFDKVDVNFMGIESSYGKC